MNQRNHSPRTRDSRDLDDSYLTFISRGISSKQRMSSVRRHSLFHRNATILVSDHVEYHLDPMVQHVDPKKKGKR